MPSSMAVYVLALATLTLGLPGCVPSLGHTRYFDGVLVTPRLTAAKAANAVVTHTAGCAHGLAYELKNERLKGRIESFALAQVPTTPVASVVAATTAEAAVLAFTPADRSGHHGVRARLFATAGNRLIWQAIIPRDQFASDKGDAISCQNLLASALSRLAQVGIYFEIDPLITRSRF